MVRSRRSLVTLRLRRRPVSTKTLKMSPARQILPPRFSRKIERAAVFVCDVSLINRGAGVRPTPNPNVLVELGYALAKVGWSRIVMVLNEASGPSETSLLT